MRTARIVMPKSARKGEIIEIKTLITHPMETGYRRDDVGKAIPRDIITQLSVTYGGTEIFRMEMFPSTAASMVEETICLFRHSLKLRIM